MVKLLEVERMFGEVPEVVGEQHFLVVLALVLAFDFPEGVVGDELAGL